MQVKKERMSTIIASLTGWLNFFSFAVDVCVVHYLGNQFSKINRYKAKGNKQMFDHLSSGRCLCSVTKISKTDEGYICELEMNEWEIDRLKSKPIDGLSALRKITKNMFSPGWTRSENDDDGF